MADQDPRYMSVEQIRMKEIEAAQTSYIKNRRAAAAPAESTQPQSGPSATQGRGRALNEQREADKQD